MSPRLTLVTAFPPSMGFRGADTSIADLSSCRMPPWFSKVQAVHTCTERNLEAGPAGKGKRAFRRVLAMFPARKAINSADKLAEFAELRGNLE
jgi:hypothetical protein